MLDIIGGFERKIVFQGKSRKCARYYEGVLKEKLTFRPKLQFVVYKVENVLDIIGAFWVEGGRGGDTSISASKF